MTRGSTARLRRDIKMVVGDPLLLIVILLVLASLVIFIISLVILRFQSREEQT